MKRHEQLSIPGRTAPVKVSKPGRILTFSVLSITALAMTIVVAPAADAYYWGYGSRGWGGNLLYSLGYFASPLLGAGPYSAYPLYSLHSNLRRANIRALAFPYRSPYYLQRYQDEEPLNAPRERLRPKRVGNVGVDEIAYARWLPPNRQYLPEQKPLSQRPYLIGSGPGTPSAPNATPPAPFAQGFVSTVNEKFNGDIKEALFDPETRSWARALGLIDNDKLFSCDLSESRIEVIKRILADPAMTPVTKLDAVRILLPAGANRASKAGL